MVTPVQPDLVKTTEVMMTEETKTNSEPAQTSSLQGKRSEKLSKLTRRVLVISSVFLVVTIVDSAFQYRDFGAWQILADASGILIALIFLLVSLYLHVRGKTEQANNLIPFVILFGYAPGDLFLEGVTLYNLGSGVLLFALAYIILKPQNNPHWLRMLVLHIALVILFSVTNIFPRFDISQSPSWQVSLPIFTAVLAVLLGWQILKTIQIKTIQSRILAILIGLGVIPTLIAITTSTAIGFQRDIQQVENYLQLISSQKNEQITSWLNQIQTDMDTLNDDPQFLDNVDFMFNDSSMDSDGDRVLTELRLSLQDLQSKTGRYLEISLVSVDGEILVSTNQALENTKIINKQYITLSLSDSYRSPLLISRETGQLRTQIYQPVKISGDVTTAIIIGNINTEFLTQTIAQASQLGETGEAYLVKGNNILLTPLRNSPESILGSFPIRSSELNDTVKNQDTRTVRTNNYLGEPVFAIYRWMPSLNSVLIIEQFESEALQSQRLNLTINIAIGITILAITITIAFFTARNFSEPIKTLSQNVSKVWQGELSQIEPLDLPDEVGELSQTLSQMTAQLIQTTSNLEITVAERTKVLERRAKYLETTSQISRALTSIYDVDSLLNTVTHLISENFGFYHIGVFIIDEQQEFAVLRAANSEGGWKMLAREHKLQVGEQGIVGYVTGTGQPRIQQQIVGEDNIHFENPDLPLTRSELALPLKAGNVIFGALDVQSTEEEAFSEEDVNVLQVLADSVAVAIQNTRLVQQLKESLET
jgi:putative methionine-R-sulfoxide reductase with GAF domain